jgi:hypothetical protein
MHIIFLFVSALSISHGKEGVDKDVFISFEIFLID